MGETAEMVCMYFFFFSSRRRHTRLQGDWSSDVCSSDLRLPFPFMLTARAENFLHDKPDLNDTVRRLQAFERAGADVLFAPGLPDLAAVRTVCSALAKPVNFMVGMRGRSLDRKSVV